MTPIQQARARAFLTQNQFRAITLLIEGTQKEFVGIRGFAPQALDEFALGSAQRTEAAIYVLRETPDAQSPLPPADYYSLGIAEETVLINKANQNERWRVDRIEDNPVNVAIVLHVNQQD